MKYEATKTAVKDLQNISKMCMVCGEENPYSLHAQFLNLEDGRLCAYFKGLDAHQSYPGRMHGGIISAMLDETIGRAIQVEHPEVFGVTMELNVRFRKPVPLEQPLKIVAWITEHKRRLFKGEGVLLLEDDTVAADATGKYMHMDVTDITDDGLDDDNWRYDCRISPTDVLA